MTATDPAVALARELADIRREVRGVSRGAQLARSSLVVDGETVSIPDTVRTSREARDVSTVALAAANGKNRVIFSVDPATAATPGTVVGDPWFQRDSSGTIIGSWEWDGSEWDPRVFGDEVLGSLTVGKLVSGEIAAGVEIIAGVATGEHTRMSSDGVAAYAEDPADGIPNEIARFGRFLGGRDPVSGEQTYNIDQTGRASFSALAVMGDPTVGGRPLLADILQKRPKGVVGQGIGIPDQSGIVAETNLFGVTWTAEEGRHYRVTVNGLRWANASSGLGNGATFVLRDGLFGAELGRTDLQSGVAFNSGHTFVVDLRAGVPAGSHNYVLSVAAAGSAVHAQYSSAQPYMMVVEDLGPSVAESGQTFAIATPDPVRTVYQETIPASWSQAYVGGGGEMSNAAGRIYQGQDPSGFNGNQKSLIGFPDLTAKFAGATINKIEVFLYAAHWYNNSGGTAVIGAHALSSQPATFAGTIDPNRIQSASWPKPGSRVVDITAWGAEFKAGSVRGVVLGPGPSTSTTYYGYFNGVGMAYAPELRINYTK